MINEILYEKQQRKLIKALEKLISHHYNPPALLRNRHVQSILASLKLRLPFVNCRAENMLLASEDHILDCGDNVRLLGKYSGHADKKRDLVILIHGWEGSADSVYLRSAAGYLYNLGFDVFRLNLRDHGDTHHLNHDLFHSCRIDEVVGAIRRVQELFSHKRLFLGGFSLGGNFSIRVALRAPAAGISLSGVVAVSPVIDPAITMDAIESVFPVYHLYFMRSWRRSLARKLALFPDMTGLRDLGEHKTISALTAYVAPLFSAFPDVTAYLRGYTITADMMEKLEVPLHILSSLDDPVIPPGDLRKLTCGNFLSIETTRYGGHCGFIKNWRFHSLAEERMSEIFMRAGN